MNLALHFWNGITVIQIFGDVQNSGRNGNDRWIRTIRKLLKVALVSVFICHNAVLVNMMTLTLVVTGFKILTI